MKMKIKSQIFYDEDGNKVGIAMELKEFEMLMEELEDAHDVYMANQRSKKNAKTIPFEKIKRELFGDAKK